MFNRSHLIYFFLNKKEVGGLCSRFLCLFQVRVVYVKVRFAMQDRIGAIILFLLMGPKPSGGGY